MLTTRVGVTLYASFFRRVNGLQRVGLKLLSLCLRNRARRIELDMTLLEVTLSYHETVFCMKLKSATFPVRNM